MLLFYLYTLDEFTPDITESEKINITGQVGAIQLGISRALQNWEPGLRSGLREGTPCESIVFSSFYI